MTHRKIHAEPQLDPALILSRQMDSLDEMPAVVSKPVRTSIARDILRCDLESGNIIRDYRALKHRCVEWMAICLSAMTASISSGCSSSTQGARAPDPTTVEVVQVEQKDVPIYTEWIGTTDGIVNADIKAQVSGYLLKQDYTEGSFVKKGQLLFEIDPRPFQAVVDQAEGQLAQTNGQLAQ